MAEISEFLEIPWGAKRRKIEERYGPPDHEDVNDEKNPLKSSVNYGTQVLGYQDEILGSDAKIMFFIDPVKDFVRGHIHFEPFGDINNESELDVKKGSDRILGLFFNSVSWCEEKYPSATSSKFLNTPSDEEIESGGFPILLYGFSDEKVGAKIFINSILDLDNLHPIVECIFFGPEDDKADAKISSILSNYDVGIEDIFPKWT